MKKLVTIYTIGLMLSSVSFGSDRIDDAQLEALYGALPVSSVPADHMPSSEIDELATSTSVAKDGTHIGLVVVSAPPSTRQTMQKEGMYIKSMKAVGEGIVIGVNGIVEGHSMHVDKAETQDDGMLLVANRGDFEIEREGDVSDTQILISGSTTPNTNDSASLSDHIQVGEMTASGGIAMGTNNGTIKIVRKNKNA